MARTRYASTKRNKGIPGMGNGSVLAQSRDSNRQQERQELDGDYMDVQLMQLQSLIKVLQAANVVYYKDIDVELRFGPEPQKTSLPPPKNQKELQADADELLMWSAG